MCVIQEGTCMNVHVTGKVYFHLEFLTALCSLLGLEGDGDKVQREHSPSL